MTFAILPASKAGLAGGLILGVAGLGNAMGPLIGGFLTDALSWRWILFVNLPIAAFAAAVTYLRVHVTEPEASDEGIDYRGIATLSIGLVALLLALDEVSDFGWGDARLLRGRLRRRLSRQRGSGAGRPGDRRIVRRRLGEAGTGLSGQAVVVLGRVSHVRDDQLPRKRPSPPERRAGLSV